MTVYEILKKLEGTPSKNEKIQILKDNALNPLLRDVLENALNPFKKHYMKSIPEYSKNEEKEFPLGLAIHLLIIIQNRELTGHDARDHVAKILSELSLEDADVYKRIILKDLKAGFGASTVNKVWKDLIPTFDVMLCQPNKEKFMKNIKFPAMSQLKSDGTRINIFYKNGEVSIFSRNGQEYPSCLAEKIRPELDKMNQHYHSSEFVLDGEGLILDENGLALDRKTGNGIFNKIKQNKHEEEVLDSVFFNLWDVVTIEEFYAKKSEVGHESRFRNVYRMLEFDVFYHFNLIEWRIVHDINQANLHFNQMRNRGEEGTIIKNLEGPWVGKRSNDLVKMKAVEDADLFIIDVLPGKEGSKYAEMMGSFLLESRCGLLEVGVGTGFSDQQRADFWEKKDELIGKVCEIQYNEIITSKSSKGKKSLFLPVFVEVRDDKDQANSLDELK